MRPSHFCYATLRSWEYIPVSPRQTKKKWVSCFDMGYLSCELFGLKHLSWTFTRAGFHEGMKGGGGETVMPFLGIIRHTNFKVAMALAMPLNENPIEMVGSFMLKWARKKAKMHDIFVML